MARKVTAIVACVFWAICGISFIFSDLLVGFTDIGVALFVIGLIMGFISSIVLGILALIDYARRPR